jgi:hypothetical protein
VKNKTIAATREHIEYVIKHTRAEDRQEIMDSIGATVEQAFMSIPEGNRVWVSIDRKGVPFMLFGVTDDVEERDGKRAGIPWMIATDELDNNWMYVLKISKEYIQRMRQGYAYIGNTIRDSSKKSIRWLKWCGFEISGRTKCGINKNVDFRIFIMEGL